MIHKKTYKQKNKPRTKPKHVQKAVSVGQRQSKKSSTKPRLKSSTKPRLKQKQVAKQSVGNKQSKKTIQKRVSPTNVGNKQSKKTIQKRVAVGNKQIKKTIQAPKIIWRDKKPVIKTVTVIKKVLDTKEIQKLAKEKTTLQNQVTYLKKQLVNKPKQTLAKQPEPNVSLVEVNKLLVRQNENNKAAIVIQNENNKAAIDKAVALSMQAMKKALQHKDEQKTKEERLDKEAQLKQVKKEKEDLLKMLVNNKTVRKNPYKLVTLNQEQKDFMQTVLITPLQLKLTEIEASDLYTKYNPAIQMPGYYIHFSNLWKQILQGHENPELFKRYAKAAMFMAQEEPGVAYSKLKAHINDFCPNFKTDYAALRASKPHTKK